MIKEQIILVPLSTKYQPSIIWKELRFDLHKKLFLKISFRNKRRGRGATPPQRASLRETLRETSTLTPSS